MESPEPVRFLRRDLRSVDGNSVPASASRHAFRLVQRLLNLPPRLRGQPTPFHAVVSAVQDASQPSRAADRASSVNFGSDSTRSSGLYAAV